MRKLTITCDCCGIDIEEDSVFKLEHYIHVSPTYNRMRGSEKTVGGKSYSVSQRMEKTEFCLPCYNILLASLFDKLLEIKNTPTK